ncbi:MAG TPA: MerR family transcriptional regulator [Polyangiaceae bacterium]
MTAAPALYRIAVAARMTGVSEHTLRVWERRYGTLASHRSDAGYRLYTSDDVDRIQRLRRLTEAGHAIGDIAKLSIADLKKLARAAAPPTVVDRVVSSEARRRFMTAVDAFDLVEAARVMATARLAFSPLELVSEVIAPLLAELGQRWIDDPGNAIAQEHAATVVLRDELMRLLVSSQQRPDGPRVAIAAPEAELHEFGALIAAVIAAAAGAHVLYLGPNLPARDLATAAKKHRADVVLLSVVSLGEKRMKPYLQILRDSLGAKIPIWVGGAAAKPSNLEGVVHIDSLAKLERLLRSSR